MKDLITGVLIGISILVIGYISWKATEYWWAKPAIVKLESKQPELKIEFPARDVVSIEWNNCFVAVNSAKKSSYFYCTEGAK